MFIPIRALVCAIALLAFNLVVDMYRFSRARRGGVSVKLADGVAVSASSVEDLDRLTLRIVLLRYHASRPLRASDASL